MTNAERQAKWRLKNPEAATKLRRQNKLRTKYGMELTEWEAMFDKQGRRCDICGTETPGIGGQWHTDHDHKTGKVRGILCQACNHGLGNFRDSILLLEQAIEYLKENEI